MNTVYPSTDESELPTSIVLSSASLLLAIGTLWAVVVGSSSVKLF
jgi:hypothetical protein